MSVINFPTFDRIMEIPLGSKVEVHLRERTGERCVVSGTVHSSESGTRKVGPFVLAGQRADRASFYSGKLTFSPYVSEDVVALTVVSSPVVSE